MIYVSKKDLNNNLITLQLNLFDMKRYLYQPTFLPMRKQDKENVLPYINTTVRNACSKANNLIKKNYRK